ncbi:protein lifeguard 1 [Eurytemora carolleeae]|uniref:protein lifeguard 1 n=1 Tax=Eurytemora carolleeae TaxID=1294199 RepID=UPI000C762D0C|nr:protein lifeguard 1 [Eurytemora carolleeae]|eukprot:XP_023327752.1 protein lifeguard 1-like [Eurytemora affinis]
MAAYGTTDDGYGGMSDTFSEKSVRLGFIRKVYSILCAQLVVTMGIVGIFTLQSVKVYAAQHQEMFFRRRTPHNFIFLGLFTVAEGFLIGTVVATYQTDEVLMAVGMCAVVTLSLTIFAFQTKIDFTAWGGALLAILVIFVLFGFICIFIPKSRVLVLVYASLGAVVFSLYIVFDTQIMIGGKHKYSLSPEEYVFGALNLYLDIINLFLYLLQIIGAARN